MNVVVTGASGFLGRELCLLLNTMPRFRLCAVVRPYRIVNAESVAEVPSIDMGTDWSRILEKQDVIIHTAARAHIMNDVVKDPLAEYRKVNVEGTLNLARQAISAGVKRFIFISSIKVNGENTERDKPFTSDDIPAPEDAYGLSKLEAERGLFELSQQSEMEIVIIRPPLVYGPGVKGNFSSMISLLNRGLPLPLGAVHNRRSLVGIDNLIDMIITCIDHPAAANQVFLAGDGKDLSTTELLKMVANSLGRPSRLLPIPAPILVLAATLTGKKRLASRLLGSLQVDISKARLLLGWVPPVSLEEGVKKCIK